MSETTKIEWATSTGNPWIGCTKVSPGCKNCYAETLDRQRFSRTMGGGTKEKPISHWGKGAPRLRTKGFWKDAIKWDRQAEEFANLEHPIRPRIFPSLCDWLDDEVPTEWLADFLKLIHDTPNLDWLLLTKRPEDFGSRLFQAFQQTNETARWIPDWMKRGNYPCNVWIGTSVEDQQRADERIPALLKIPAKVRFLSVEPLLSQVDLRLSETEQDSEEEAPCHKLTEAGCLIDWIIVGGESGQGARLCNIEWIRSIVSQCKSAQVPCFVKQLGSVPVSPGLSDQHGVKVHKFKHPKGGDMNEWPEDCRVRQFPKLASGSL